jgi:hypothetical protein
MRRSVLFFLALLYSFSIAAAPPRAKSARVSGTPAVRPGEDTGLSSGDQAISDSHYSSTFVPQHYQDADGALVLQTDGDYVEPYFATKALLVAQDMGMDIKDAGLKWVQWALAHQRKDGKFERYCRKQGENWKPCAAADADDSMQAMWLQLLYRLAPDSGIPAEWRSSVDRARAQLGKLRNVRLGIYHVSTKNHAMLFMDNVEVYSALKDIAQAERRFGNQQAADATNEEASKLAAAIQHVFWDEHYHRFRPDIEKTKPAFYPDVVAQVFPWLADLPVPGEDEQAAWSQWKQNFEPAWLETKYDTHPWGLVAVAAWKVGDEGTALCWVARAEPLRYSTRWNLLEEAAFQGLEYRLQNYRQTGVVACSAAGHREGAGQP